MWSEKMKKWKCKVSHVLGHLYWRVARRDHNEKTLSSSLSFSLSLSLSIPKNLSLWFGSRAERKKNKIWNFLPLSISSLFIPETSKLIYPTFFFFGVSCIRYDSSNNIFFSSIFFFVFFFLGSLFLLNLSIGD